MNGIKLLKMIKRVYRVHLRDWGVTKVIFLQETEDFCGVS